MDQDAVGLWIKPENHADNWKAAGIKRMNSEGETIRQAKDLYEKYEHISHNTL